MSELERPTDQEGVVDGFSDSKGDGETPDAPDKGTDPHAKPPLSPEEYAKLQKEAREED